jgi:hypothetical protein
MNFGEIEVLVDPVLVGNLDFGIPLLYSGMKRYIYKLSRIIYGY